MPPLLREVAERWSTERESWAFTQQVRETDRDGTVHRRRERYDPTRGERNRWRLLQIDGREPTAADVAQWEERKNARHHKAARPLGDYVDLDAATVTAANADAVTYNLPARSAAEWVFPAGKVAVAITVNKHTHEIERAQVGINGPFRVALGLINIVDLDFDVTVPRAKDDGSANPPHGTAYAVVNRLGKRVEYTWSEFTRVAPPARANAASAGPP
ncbi:MAG TPA: hypothetical protein VL200_06495 [Lacunisphaera sp.]|jgi:hypothetical protein|nr:hypothetical protein [Lacunisphaera sp.]